MKPKKMHPAGKRGAEQNNVSSPQSRALSNGVKLENLSLLGIRRVLGVEPIAPLSLRIGRIARRAIACHNPTMLARAVQPAWVFVRLEWTRHGASADNPDLLAAKRYQRVGPAPDYVPPPLLYRPEDWQSILRCCS